MLTLLASSVPSMSLPIKDLVCMIVSKLLNKHVFKTAIEMANRMPTLKDIYNKK
jgi:hypothetical protein